MQQKRSAGEGTMRKRPNGLWECTIMIDVQADGRRKYKSFYARTKKELTEKLQAFQMRTEAERIENKVITFEQWADQWYAGYRESISASTYESYRFTLAILKDYFGSWKLSAIKAMDIEDFLKYQSAEGRSQSYLSKMRGMMFQIMKKAMANDLIVKNPVACADKMKAKPPVRPKDSFTEFEIACMMEGLPKDRIGYSIRLMLGTGMRTQELLALEPRHIEPDGSVIHIEQAITMVRGTPYLGPPKTKTSYRDIPVPEKIQFCARALRETDRPYIWSSPKGRYINPSNFRKKYVAALERLKRVRVLSPHCCRHTYVSHLQAAGVPLETIQLLSGHAQMDMTQHYLHIQKNVKLDAVNRLNQVL